MMYAFKQGKVNPDAFEQDKIWYDAEGMPHLIKELPYSYARNILAKIHKMGLYHSSPLTKAIRARMVEAKKELST